MINTRLKPVTTGLIGAVGLGIGLLVVSSKPLQAATVVIEDGWDLFTTVDFPVSFYTKKVDIPGVGQQEVRIEFERNVFVPGTNIDTKLRRIGTCTLLDPALNPTTCEEGPNAVKVQMAGLSFKSRTPVTINANQYDVDIVSGDLLGKPANLFVPVTITRTTDMGGEIFIPNLQFDVMVTFTNINNDNDVIMQTHPISFDPWTGVWSVKPGPLDPHTDDVPSGGFYAGIDPLTGQKAILPPHIQPGEAHYFQTAHKTPEPSSILGLIAVGLSSIVGFKGKKEPK
ncbi:hypothetical protein H6F92_08115 [Microcystis wesenbergii FACHB-1317]|uniref:hypothetical protein n=1 Tax=Microcystis TaxID=1125 RepID=UPI00167FEC24|nr:MULTISPECIES: hypothetical protein [Microcystis]MBD2288772.1 hypothetical protein [Microcystis wesenbergii FACHB-1317]UZO77368.1 hypothetical protein M8120_05105 [Microcystis aeruginosa str. Chao 1910]